LAYNLPLLTHNASDYRDVPGLRVVSHSQPDAEHRPPEPRPG